MTPEYKITTHIAYSNRRGDWFSAAIDGRPLVGQKGGYSVYSSRRAARQAAKDIVAGLRLSATRSAEKPVDAESYTPRANIEKDPALMQAAQEMKRRLGLP